LERTGHRRHRDQKKEQHTPPLQAGRLLSIELLAHRKPLLPVVGAQKCSEVEGNTMASAPCNSRSRSDWQRYPGQKIDLDAAPANIISSGELYCQQRSNGRGTPLLLRQATALIRLRIFFRTALPPQWIICAALGQIRSRSDHLRVKTAKHCLFFRRR
jgi:hypothetical protein